MSLAETIYDEQAQLWHGPERTAAFDASISIAEHIYNALKEQPTHTYQIKHAAASNQVVSKAQTLSAAIRLATFLEAEGLSHQHVVGIIARNSPEVTQLIFACLFNATPFHAVNPAQDAHAIAAIYAITKPKFIFCNGKDYKRIAQATKQWKPVIIAIEEQMQNILGTAEENQHYRPQQLVEGAAQIMAIICSSGTTGLPKAVTLTNAQLCQVAPYGSSDDVVYTTAGYDWLTGIKTLLANTLYGASSVVSSAAFSVPSIQQLIRQHKVSICHMSHWQFNELFTSALVDPAALASLQLIVYGGGWVAAKLVQRARELLESTHLLGIYGTTETDIVAVCVNATEDNLAGMLLPGVSLRIVNAAGENLGLHQVGEVLIKTNLSWRGYCNNAAATAQTLDAQGWYHMGDLGYFDEQQYLYIVDRKKDVLKFKGMQYTPNEIERVIRQLPQVLHVCVVGMRHELYGDMAGALIVKQPLSALTAPQVALHVAQSLPQHKQLHAGVLFVPQLPVNANGKLLRAVAKQMFQQQQQQLLQAKL
ncbi:CG4563 [Drosophila busckii]|uniref:CG4563 n=1 Tax=Drosophila busckii TaxID=30019 RepID=A0A0M4EM03_DROBS|nr:4-coumarate--CoA ligase 1 isoform X2 [Drosophila busckii]ALC42705.1 CG4563 [Drosophila busckii]